MRDSRSYAAWSTNFPRRLYLTRYRTSSGAYLAIVGRESLGREKIFERALRIKSARPEFLISRHVVQVRQGGSF